MAYKLTFNKPAVRQIGEADGVRIKIGQDGVVMFQTSTVGETDTTSLQPRTRGGYETFIEGEGSETPALLKALHNDHGPFFILTKKDDWHIASPWPKRDAPPKFEPHVRLWHADFAGAPTAPGKKKTARKARAKAQPITPELPYLDKVRWAYRKLDEPRGPGRPGKDMTEAHEIKQQFEEAARKVAGKGAINVAAMIDSYEMIGNFLSSLGKDSVTKTKALATKAVLSHDAAIGELSKIGKPIPRRADAHAH